MNHDNSLMVTITVTCNLWTPSSGDYLFTCGAIYLPPHGPGYNWCVASLFGISLCCLVFIILV